LDVEVVVVIVDTVVERAGIAGYACVSRDKSTGFQVRVGERAPTPLDESWLPSPANKVLL
jgi:hypothetical protein